MEAVEVTVVDIANGGVPVPDARLDVYDDTGAVFITFQRTDSSGTATLSLNPDDYTVRVFKPGVSSVDREITVANIGGTSMQQFTVNCEAVSVTPPASPQLCRLYADFLSFDGLPLENFELQVSNLYDPETSAGMAVMEYERVYRTDSAGHVEFDVVRGTKIRVALLTSPWVRDIKVPDKPAENLLDAAAAAVDAFQIVKHQ